MRTSAGSFSTRDCGNSLEWQAADAEDGEALAWRARGSPQRERCADVCGLSSSSLRYRYHHTAYVRDYKPRRRHNRY
jgi:hypothetical protein